MSESLYIDPLPFIDNKWIDHKHKSFEETAAKRFQSLLGYRFQGIFFYEADLYQEYEKDVKLIIQETFNERFLWEKDLSTEDIPNYNESIRLCISRITDLIGMVWIFNIEQTDDSNKSKEKDLRRLRTLFTSYWEQQLREKYYKYKEVLFIYLD